MNLFLVFIGVFFEVCGRNMSVWSFLIEWEFDLNVWLVFGVFFGFYVYYLNINDSYVFWNFKIVCDFLVC